MLTEVKASEQEVTWYEIPFPATAYTFPSEALIHQVQFDEKYVHLRLTDGRILSIPLWWVPTLYHAAPEERLKFTSSQDRQTVLWNPDDCAINDELTIRDYLVVR